MLLFLFHTVLVVSNKLTDAISLHLYKSVISVGKSPIAFTQWISICSGQKHGTKKYFKIWQYQSVKTFVFGNAELYFTLL